MNIRTHIITETKTLQGICANIYKHNAGDSSNNGISSKYDQVFVAKEGQDNIPEFNGGIPVVKIVRRKLGKSMQNPEGTEYVHLEPAGEANKGKGFMYGGCLVYYGDSRFGEMIGHNYPVKLHDRTEA